MKRIEVGLTGGLAGGKSTVARLLAEHGCHVVDADRIVAELYAPGQPGADAVARLFGPAALTADGGVDHEAVAHRVFTDRDARRRLERAVHPLVRDRYAAWAAEREGVLVMEATLLVEAGLAPDFDLVVSVEAAPELRLARAVGRGMEPAEAARRLAAQGTGMRRREVAHRLLDNDGSPAELEAVVAELVAELRARRADDAPVPACTVLVTGNAGKLAEARRLAGFELDARSIDLPEIQAASVAEVATAKAEEARRRLGRPVIVDETSLELDALGGFPGPLIHWLLAAVGAEGIARLAHSMGNPGAVARCRLQLLAGDRRVHGEGAVRGRIAPVPRGDGGFGWDSVFVPDGAELTWAQTPAAQKDRESHRARAWRDLLRRLREAGGSEEAGGP